MTSSKMPTSVKIVFVYLLSQLGRVHTLKISRIQHYWFLIAPPPPPHERRAPKNAMSNRVNNKSIQRKRLFFVKDSFSREVTNFHVFLYMASLDVESLPTNILLQETISNAVQDLFHVHHYRGNLSKDDLKSLLSMATTQSIFVFNDQLYRQIDGV